MTREGAGLSIDAGQLISSVLTLLPVPVAVIDAEGSIVLANSCFKDMFPYVDCIAGSMYEVTVRGRGTYDLEAVPLNDQGYKILCGTDVSKEICLRRQLTQVQGHGLGASPATAAHISCNLNEIVRCVAREREPFTRGERIGIWLDLDSYAPQVKADPEGIAKVLTALMINAEQAIVFEGRPSGSIRVKTWLEHESVRLSIGDNEAGPARHLTTPGADSFLPESNPLHPTSVGWCAEMIKDYGGELFCWSSYAVGSTYTMELPAVEAGFSPLQQQGF